MAILCVDVSAVGERCAREHLLTLIRGAGHPCRSFGSFWGSFASRSDELPEGVLVLGDLGTIVRRYTQSRPHEWIASVREKRPYFVGLVRTKTGRVLHKRNRRPRAQLGYETLPLPGPGEGLSRVPP